MLPGRLQRLPERRGPDGLRVFTAVSIRARLLGLALLHEIPAGCALLIPRCSSIHTFGMRFDIDVGFLGPEGEVLRVELGVGARRIVRCRGAAAVLEWRAGCGGEARAEGERLARAAQRTYARRA